MIEERETIIQNMSVHMKTNTNVRYSCNEDINNSRINTLLHTNTHDEHLKAGSVSAILQATGEFIKKLPLATEA